MYSMRYVHRYDKDTTACRSKKQNYDGGTPADFFDCFSLVVIWKYASISHINFTLNT